MLGWLLPLTTREFAWIPFTSKIHRDINLIIRLGTYVARKNGHRRGLAPRQRTWICIRNIGCDCALHTAIPCGFPPAALAPNRLRYLLRPVVQNTTTNQQTRIRYAQPTSHRRDLIQTNHRVRLQSPLRSGSGTPTRVG